MEKTKGFGERDVKGPTKDCFLFGSLFSSKKLVKDAVYFFAVLIGMVKNNKKGFLKETIAKLTKNCPGGSYLVLKSKPMASGVG